MAELMLRQSFRMDQQRWRQHAIKVKPVTFLMCMTLFCAACWPSSFTDRRPRRSEEKIVVLDGRCIATLKYNANGSIEDITAVSVDPSDTNSCGVAEKENLTVRGIKLLDNSGSITLEVEAHGVRGSAGKMICYGPPVPSPPRCVCTAKPCP
jgi:hypothetical protein